MALHCTEDEEEGISQQVCKTGTINFKSSYSYFVPFFSLSLSLS
jgi:hypothetical protein